MTKVIGVLGGMGPQATLDLLHKLNLLSGPGPEQNQVRILVDMDPTVPDRTEALFHGQEEAVTKHLLSMTRGLLAQGAELLAVACNTAHAFLPEVEERLGVKFVSMVDNTLEALDATGLEPVGLLATDGTIRANLYTRSTPMILPDSAHQHLLMEAIYLFKTGEKITSVRKAQTVYEHVLSRGARIVIAGCTELPVILAGRKSILDPTLILARELVALARAQD